MPGTDDWIVVLIGKEMQSVFRGGKGNCLTLHGWSGIFGMPKEPVWKEISYAGHP